MSAICNNDCICIDCDCKFAHPIPIKDRKVVRKLYDKIQCPNKNEPNAQLRKANCRFGKLCYNENCGYRHRLSHADRTKLIDGFNQSKIDATKTEKPPKVIVAKSFVLEDNNAFVGLDIDAIEQVPQITTVAKIDKPCWADVVKQQNWADMAGDDDDDFYMKF